MKQTPVSVSPILRNGTFAIPQLHSLSPPAELITLLNLMMIPWLFFVVLANI